MREPDPVRLVVLDNMPVVADRRDAPKLRLAISILVYFYIPFPEFAPVANARPHKAPRITKLRLGRIGRFRGLDIVEAEVTVIAFGDQLVDRHDALPADDPAFLERTRIAIEPHLLRRHRGDLGQGLRHLVLDDDAIIGRRLRR